MELVNEVFVFPIAIVRAVHDGAHMVLVVGGVVLGSWADDESEALLELVLPVVHAADADHAGCTECPGRRDGRCIQQHAQAHPAGMFGDYHPGVLEDGTLGHPIGLQNGEEPVVSQESPGLEVAGQGWWGQTDVAARRRGRFGMGRDVVGTVIEHVRIDKVPLKVPECRATACGEEDLSTEGAQILQYRAGVAHGEREPADPQVPPAPTDGDIPEPGGGRRGKSTVGGRCHAGTGAVSRSVCASRRHSAMNTE